MKPYNHIPNYDYEDVDCQYCLYMVRKKCVADGGCPFIPERLHARRISYEELLTSTFRIPASVLKSRLGFLADNFNGTVWNDPAHPHRYRDLRTKTFGYQRSHEYSFIAALYLLSANEELYRRANCCIYGRNLCLARLALRDLSPENYGIAQAAKTLFDGEDKIGLTDLQDTEVVDTDTFRLIINALLIARYGPDVTRTTY